MELHHYYIVNVPELVPEEKGTVLLVVRDVGDPRNRGWNGNPKDALRCIGKILSVRSLFSCL